MENVWHLVKMTNKQIEYIDFFEENIDRLLSYDLNKENEFQEVYDEIQPVISTLQKYSKYGMTFSISSRADELIKMLLVKSGNEKLLETIENLSKQEYFVE